MVLHWKRHGVEAHGEKVVSSSVFVTASRRRPRLAATMTLTLFFFFFCHLSVSFFQIKTEGRASLRPRVFGGWL